MHVMGTLGGEGQNVALLFWQWLCCALIERPKESGWGCQQQGLVGSYRQWGKVEERRSLPSMSWVLTRDWSNPHAQEQLIPPFYREGQGGPEPSRNLPKLPSRAPS